MLSGHGCASIVLHSAVGGKLSPHGLRGERFRGMKLAIPTSQQPRLDAAVSALREQDFARAADLLRQLAAELPAAAMPWEMLARAEEGRGERAAAAAAL